MMALFHTPFAPPVPFFRGFVLGMSRGNDAHDALQTPRRWQSHILQPLEHALTLELFALKSTGNLRVESDDHRLKL